MKIIGPIIVFLLLLATNTLAADAPANLPPPPLSHTTRQIEGWTVRVDDRLLSGDGKSMGDAGIKLLTARLVLIGIAVPEKPLAKLREVVIQLDLTHGVLRSMQYHPDAGWLKENGYSEQLARCVHIPDVQDLLSPYENHRQPWAVLHELAHAYHDQVLGFDEPRIRAAWNTFRESGRYTSVLTSPGGMREHYALTDEKEFFAEMTECYLGTNDFYPFVAGELKQAEPELFALLRDIWGPLPERDKPSASNKPSASHKPLKVFILAGQSNMQGHASISTFDSLAEDPKTAPILKLMRDAEGKPRVCDKVWISSIGCLGDAYSDLQETTGKLTAGFGAPTDKIGPEFTFGLYLEKTLDEPILIIKTSWGGRSLHTDFRPPSAGPETFNDFIVGEWKKRGLDTEKESAKVNKDAGVFYRHMIEHVQKVLKDIKRVVPEYDEKQGYELAGFVWFQGFNDYVDSWTYQDQMKPGGYDLYGELLAHFIRDVRKDLSAPKMPFVIGVMGIGGETEGKKAPQMYFRQAQAAPALLPEFKGNVTAVQTAPFWDNDLDALHERMEKLNAELDQAAKKEPRLTPEETDAARQRAVGDHFTPDELKRLKGGVSNGGYHYLGAAKILALIGKAFAEAVVGPPPTAEKEGRIKPIQVFILAGQSNMEGQGFIKADPQRNGGKGSLEHLAKDPATADKFRHLLDQKGEWAVRDDVWIDYLDRKGRLTVGYGAKEDRIGPELGFGNVIGDAYEEPVLLIKLAWGGKSLAKDFRPPSSGGEVGPYYKEIVQRTKAVLGDLKKEFPELGDRPYELAGFGWHQGWNDRVNQAFNDEYENNMANFIRDIRKDLGVPRLPFVVAETGMTGPAEKHPRALSLMKAQAAVAEYPEFQGNVAFVGTKTFWHDKEVSPTGQGYHWNTNAETYYLIGEAMGVAMKNLRMPVK